MTTEAVTEFSLELEQIWSKMDHQFKVVRVEAMDNIFTYLENKAQPGEQELLFERILSASKDLKKERRQTCFILGAKFLAKDEEFCEKMFQLGKEHLTDPDSPVREAVAEMFESLARIRGIEVYVDLKDKLFELIDENFDEEEAPENKSDVVEASIKREKRVLEEKLAGLKSGVDSWKVLFTAFKTLEKIIWGLGKQFENNLNEEFLHLTHRCSRHINRFVREASYNMYGAIILALSPATFDQFGTYIAQELRTGLGDNWSQVRHASTVSTRHFMQQCPTPESYYDILLPPMCLNRYYVAAGVRTYSLETWKLCLGESGRNMVARHAAEVTAYYITQAQADNHAVREAACHCIAELGNKIDPDSLRDHIPVLLDTLIGCFKDESWPVRDSACLALGNFVSKFPKESENDLEELYTLWFEHLSDNIPSVRADTAVALGKVLQAYGDDALERYIPLVQQHFDKIQEQLEESSLYGGLEAVTTFGVAPPKMGMGMGMGMGITFGASMKRKRDNDPLIHTGQAQYSCGSLAPKMKKASRCGCMDHGFSRDREPWEYTDGAICLATEMIKYKPSLGPDYLAQIAEIGAIRHFAHHNKLQENIWTQVPKIAEGMGKKLFKQNIELGILYPLLETLESGTMLSKATAGKCIMFFYDFLGESIFEARLSTSQRETIDNSPHVRKKTAEEKLAASSINYTGGFTPGYLEALQKMAEQKEHLAMN